MITNARFTRIYISWRYARIASEGLLNPSATNFVYDEEIPRFVSVETAEPRTTTVHRIDPNGIYGDLPRVNGSVATSRTIYDNSFDIRCMSKEDIMDYMIKSGMITEVHK